MNTDITEPHLTYHGNLVDDLLHRVLGPDEFNGYVVVAYASYDTLLNITDAYCRPLGPGEMSKVTVFEGQRYLYPEADA